MSRLTIKLKMILTFVVAFAAMVAIGLSGYLNITKMNGIISESDFTIVQPLVHLSKITYDIGQIKTGVLKTVIFGETDLSVIDACRADIYLNIDGYKKILDENGVEDNDEYRSLIALTEKISEWFNEIDVAVNKIMAAQTDEAAILIKNIVGDKGAEINSLLEALVAINEKEAIENRVSAEKSIGNAEILILVIFVLSAGVMVLTGMIFVRHLGESVDSIINSAEALADGSTEISLEGLPSDEIGSIGVAIKQIADSISELISDNHKVLTDVGDGFLSARVETRNYKGGFYKILHGVNMTLQTFCRHLDIVPAAISFFDPDGRFVYGNKTMFLFLPIFGLNPIDEGMLAHILSSGKNRTLPAEAQAVFSVGGDSFYASTVNLFKSNEEKPYTFELNLHGVPDPDENINRPSCVMLTIMDVTEVTRAKSEAERSSRVKTEFLSNMSHEIRTPMNAVIGMTQIARRSSDMAKVQECINKIESSSHHLLGVLNDILDMSKIEAGKLVLSEEKIKLTENINFVVSLMRSRAFENKLELTQDISIVSDYCLVDPLRLNQVMINLYSNAIKFSPNGGNIHLTVSEVETGGEVSEYLFSVSDQGIGITDEQKTKLFKSFEQADMSTTKRFGGTGLGLSICKNIVEMMNGRIWFESEFGKGSKFYFTVRLKTVDADAEEPAVVKDPEAEPVKNLSSLNAMIADDIEINRVIVVEMLADTGIKIEEAANGREALELFRNSEINHYDIIFMDLQMPEMDGCEATEAIRALNRPDALTTPIVAMSANVLQADVEQALNIGMNGHIAKPIDYGNVLQTISRMCLNSQ